MTENATREQEPDASNANQRPASNADGEECRNLSCSNEARSGGNSSRLFCSTACETKHDHIRADAREARRDDERAAREEDGL